MLESASISGPGAAATAAATATSACLSESQGGFISLPPRQPDGPIAVALAGALTGAWLFLLAHLTHQEERNLSDNGGQHAGFEDREAVRLHAHQAAADSSDHLMGSLATHVDSTVV